MNGVRRLLHALDAIVRLHFAQEDAMHDGLADTQYRRTSCTMELA